MERRIPDPDNPSQPRQIDITLRREDALTMIECRIHAATQDVQWIEELMDGRFLYRMMVKSSFPLAWRRSPLLANCAGREFYRARKQLPLRGGW